MNKVDYVKLSNKCNETCHNFEYQILTGKRLSYEELNEYVANVMLLMIIDMKIYEVTDDCMIDSLLAELSHK